MVLALSSLRNPYITHRLNMPNSQDIKALGRVLISHFQVTFLFDSFASLSHAG